MRRCFAQVHCVVSLRIEGRPYLISSSEEGLIRKWPCDEAGVSARSSPPHPSFPGVAVLALVSICFGLASQQDAVQKTVSPSPGASKKTVAHCERRRAVSLPPCVLPSSSLDYCAARSAPARPSVRAPRPPSCLDWPPFRAPGLGLLLLASPPFLLPFLGPFRIPCAPSACCLLVHMPQSWGC